MEQAEIGTDGIQQNTRDQFAKDGTRRFNRIERENKCLIGMKRDVKSAC